MLAPIIIFAYNRPDHLHRTLTALQQNPLADQSDLFIYCDGAKTPQQQAPVDETRTVADAAKGFAKVTVVKREHNWGLAKNIVDGVSQIVRDYGTIIVVEDDILTSPYFLTYMNDALTLYSGNPKVACISGWCFPHDVPNPPETFFLKGADCWGWATSADKWAVYNPDGRALLKDIRTRKLEREFDRDGAYDYVGMLKLQIAERIDSWAIRWYASAFLADMYCLYPGRSLVANIGLDGSGTHCGSAPRVEQSLGETSVCLQTIPTMDNHDMHDTMRTWLRQSGNPFKRFLLHHFPWLLPLRNTLRSVLRRQ